MTIAYARGPQADQLDLRCECVTARNRSRGADFLFPSQVF